MVTIYVAALAPMAGKTAFCAALGMRLNNEGKRVGYFRQISSRADHTGQEGDGAYMAELLGLTEGVDTLAPRLPTDVAAIRTALPAAVAEAASGKDVMLVEEGRAWPLIPEAPHEPARIIDAKAVLIARYRVGLLPSAVVTEAQALGSTLAGVILNAVPESLIQDVRASFVPALEEQGVRVLGVVPEERQLLALTFRTLVEQLGGQFVVDGDHADQIVDRVMVGPMSVDPAVGYFGRHQRKAVVTRLGRADLQMGALFTNTVGLILTGSGKLAEVVRQRAKSAGVPIAVVADDTMTALGNLEGAWTERRLREPPKARIFLDLMSRNVDFRQLYSALGLV